MSTVSTVLTFARTQVQSDSNGLTDTNGLIFANEALLDFRRRLIAGGIDAAQTQEAYRSATANQGTYLYPTDMFWLKAIEVNFTDANPQNYITATQVDVSNLSSASSFSELRLNCSTNSPQFDDRGDQFEVFPTFKASDNLNQAIRIFYYLEPTEYTAISDTIAYPETLDYRALGWRIASDYLYSLQRINEGDAFNLKYEERVRQLIATLGRGSQQPIEATVLQLTGWNF